VITVNEIALLLAFLEGLLIFEALMKNYLVMKISDGGQDKTIGQKCEETIEGVRVDIRIIGRDIKVPGCDSRELIFKFILVVDGFS
jgi:hypothetical protein